MLPGQAETRASAGRIRRILYRSRPQLSTILRRFAEDLHQIMQQMQQILTQIQPQLRCI